MWSLCSFVYAALGDGAWRSTESADRWDVFCIHSGQDKDHARKLHHALAVDRRVFLDEAAIPAGSSWQQQLDTALQASRVFAVFCSSSLDKSFYANAEIVTAVNMHRRYPAHRRIVPLLLEPKSDIVTAMPFDLRGIQGIEVSACGGMDGVASRLRGTLDSLEDVGPIPTEVTPASPAPAAVRHVLLQYPRAPLVPSHKIPTSVKQAFATLIRPREARQVVDDANAFRQEADAGDQTVTLIKQFRLRSPEDNAPIDFWIDAFAEAGKHGPRMLAALVLVFEDNSFPDNAERECAALLQFLRQPN